MAWSTRVFWSEKKERGRKGWLRMILTENAPPHLRISMISIYSLSPTGPRGPKISQAWKVQIILIKVSDRFGPTWHFNGSGTIYHTLRVQDEPKPMTNPTRSPNSASWIAVLATLFPWSEAACDCWCISKRKHGSTPTYSSPTRTYQASCCRRQLVNFLNRCWLYIQHLCKPTNKLLEGQAVAAITELSDGITKLLLRSHSHSQALA